MLDALDMILYASWTFYATVVLLAFFATLAWIFREV